MFDIRTGPAADCSGLSRRSFLRVGGLAPFGLTLPAYLKARAEGPPAPARRAKRCILLWMQGGPSHHNTFDPKPDAPAEVRGEFVTDNPVSPQDLAATIYTVLGINLHTWYRAQDGRPIELCPEGKPVRDLV